MEEITIEILDYVGLVFLDITCKKVNVFFQLFMMLVVFIIQVLIVINASLDIMLKIINVQKFMINVKISTIMIKFVTNVQTARNH